MFEYLKQFKKILVAGPQRSGTRIATKMIAQDTGHRFVDESEIGFFDKDKLWDMIKYDTEFVVQCPTLSLCIDEFSADDVLIIYMIRPLEDIEASRQRMKAHPERRPARHPIPEELKPLAPEKYKRWEEQKKTIKHWQEVEYNSLSAHSLWMDKEKRQDFQWNQTYEHQFDDPNLKVLCKI